MPFDFDHRIATRWPGLQDVGIARGVFDEIDFVHKFGSIASAGTAETDIWTQGGKYTGWLLEPKTVRIKEGGTTGDTSGGIGAGQIAITGLASGWLVASETIMTTGSSASAFTTTKFLRVYRANITNVGTYTGWNVGKITLESSSADVLCAIASGQGQTTMTMYTVPASTTAYLKGFSAYVDGAQRGSVRMWQRRDADDIAAPMTGRRLVTEVLGLSGSHNDRYPTPIPFPAKTDLWWTGRAATSNTRIAVNYDLILVKP